jgi:hypothetical protein
MTLRVRIGLSSGIVSLHTSLGDEVGKTPAGGHLDGLEARLGCETSQDHIAVARVELDAVATAM